VDHSTSAPFVRWFSCCALLVVPAWLVGCSQPQRSTEHAEVTGKVLFDNKPLPGGQISFVAVKGGFAASGKIDENGHYEIKAPIGEVTITVDNAALQVQGQAAGGGGAKKTIIKGKGSGSGGGAPPPKELPHPKEVAGEVQAVKGKWVSIPSRYSNADTSELKYTVTPGPQTHDVNLTSAPAR